VIVKCRLLEGLADDAGVGWDGMGWGVWWRRRFVQVMAGGVFDGVAFRVAPGKCVDFHEVPEVANNGW
jgi:hypothetical protein